MFRTAFFALAAGLSFSAPAMAQDVPAPPAQPLPDPNDQSDALTIAVAGAYVPDYEGSGDYRLIPAGAIRGRYKGVNFATRATWLYADFVPRGAGKLDFDLGPIAGVRFKRPDDIKDPLVDRLPRLKTAIEVGAFAGVSLHGLTNPYDALSLRVDVLHDVGGAHRSTLVSPNIDFSTPLSRTTYVGLSAGLDFATAKYARYYFGITPAEAVMSGLPAYSPGGGLKDWKVGLLANQSITGDLLHGLSLFGTAGYSKLQGDYRRSPLVAQRGKAGQWLLAAGLAYSF